MNLSASESLNQTMAQSPAARADKVALARALVADPSYPSDRQVLGVASLLAKHWGSAAE